MGSFCADIFSSKKLPSQTVTREKLSKTLSYDKGLHKMLMKLVDNREIGFRSGMHNIRPTGQMWPVKAFNMARATPNFVYFTCY